MRPHLKVVALASATHPDAALLALQAELAVADQAWEALYSKRVAAEDACFAALPPPSEAPDLDSDTLRKAFLSGKALSPVFSLLHGFAPGLVGLVVCAQGLDGFGFGLKAAEEAVNAADHVRLAIRDKIISIRAKTLAGLTFKARYAASHFPGNPDEDVMTSIVDDILAMAGET